MLGASGAEVILSASGSRASGSTQMCVVIKALGVQLPGSTSPHLFFIFCLRNGAEVWQVLPLKGRVGGDRSNQAQ